MRYATKANIRTKIFHTFYRKGQAIHEI